MIEGVLESTLGKPYHLVTMMLRDWSDAVEGVGKPQAEELKLEHEEAEAGGENHGLMRPSSCLEKTSLS